MLPLCTHKLGLPEYPQVHASPCPLCAVRSHWSTTRAAHAGIGSDLDTGTLSEDETRKCEITMCRSATIMASLSRTIRPLWQGVGHATEKQTHIPQAGSEQGICKEWHTDIYYGAPS